MSQESEGSNEKLGQFWQQHIAEWSRSGLTQNAYCRANNLKSNQLPYWKNKFRRQNLPVEFVQVSPAQVSQSLHCPTREFLRLNVGPGYQIEVPDGFSQNTLTHVLHVLRGF